MDSYSQQLASLKAKSGAGVTIYSDDTRRNTYLVVLPKQAHGVRNLHLDDRQHRGEIYGEMTPSEAP
ncbi:hypothetical protein ACKUS5_00085 [Serratia marcescens]